MKVCQIIGDMSAEKTRDNYPTNVFCDECYENKFKAGLVLTTEPYDMSWSNSCSECGKLEEEEKIQKK